MTSTAIKKEKSNKITVVKKMRDYSQETVFKKKIEDAQTFIQEKGLPESLLKKEE
jgi:hypothetical protein